MNNDKFYSNVNNTGKGRTASETYYRKKSTSKAEFGGYAADNAVSKRASVSTSGGGQLNFTILQHRSLEQLIVTNDDVNPMELTIILQQCKTLPELKILYHLQKNKNYFNFIHSSACFSQAINLYTTFEGDKNIPAEELGLFADSILSYSKELNSRALANVINDAMKLLDYTQYTLFQDVQGAEALALGILSSVFAEISVRNLQDFEPQVLASLFNDAVKLLDYLQHKPFQGSEELKLITRFFLFQEINNRENLHNFDSQSFASLANDLVQAGYWNNVTSKLLSKIGINVNQSNFTIFSVQDICSLAWSFSVGQQLSLIWNWLLNELSTLDVQEIYELTIENAKQLYSVFLRRAIDSSVWNQKNPNVFLMVYLQQNLVQKILQKLNEEAAEYSIQTLELQKSVGSVLEKILLKDCSIIAENSIRPYPINFTIVKGSNLLAIIDVNGPWKPMCKGHYNLAHAFQEKLLKDMGYSAILYIDFNELNNSKNQEILLRLKLSRISRLNNEDEIILIDNSKLNSDLIKSNKHAIHSSSAKPILNNKSFQSINGIQPTHIETPVRKQNTTSNVHSNSKPVIDSFINSQKMVNKTPSNLKKEVKDKI